MSEPRVTLRQALPNTPVTMALMGACVVLWIIGYFDQRVVSTLIYAPILGIEQPYRFLGAAFLHASFWHLLFNMYALWLVGLSLEPLLGKLRFLVLYVVSAVAGNVVFFLAASITDQWLTAVVGASGAVFGLFGALFVISRASQLRNTSLLVVIGINLVLGFVIPGIAWQSHLGGLVFGAGLMWMWIEIRNWAIKRHRSKYHVWVLDTLAVAVVVGIIAAIAVFAMP